MKDLEKRMYFLVPYNISEIQKGIQAGHAAMEYARKYRDDEDFIDFADNHKTWIILNGGTTNSRFDEEGNFKGTLNQVISDIIEFDDIKYATFNEPDLNDALTAICLIVDERVFNRKDYPDFDVWVNGKIEPYDVVNPNIWDIKYEEYENEIGKDIAFLKKLLNTKKLA